MAGKGKAATANLIKIVGGVVVLALIGAGWLYSQSQQRKEAAAIAEAWTVAGEVCPTPAAAVTAAPARGLVYEGVTFQRDRGAINCNVIHPGGTGPGVPVCMFMGPGNLRVVTSAGTFDYAPPSGVPATVTIREGGQPECVTHFNRAVFN